MLRYIVRRLLMMIPVLIGATLIVFAIMDSSPGDPALSKVGVEASPEQVEEMRESMGLNDPFFIRYGRFLLGLLHGDLGTSYKNDLSVMEQVMSRLPNTFILSFAALLFAMAVGIPVGIISARRQYTIFDNITMVLTLIGAAAPHFWLGLMGVIIFAVNLGWLPAAYSGSSPYLLCLILPMLTLGLNSTATITRMTRSAMLDVMNQDYIDTARAKGVSEKRVTFVPYAPQRADSHYHSGRPPIWLPAGGRGDHRDYFRLARDRPVHRGVHQQQGHPLCAGRGGPCWR